MIPTTYKEKQRYYFSERSAAGGASLSRTRTFNLQSFDFVDQGSPLIVVDNLCVNAAYELAASPNGFQACGASIEFTGLNDASGKPVRNLNDGLISSLYFPDRVQLVGLNIELQTIQTALTFIVTIEPGTAILAAAINSIRVQINIGIDVYYF